MPSFINFKDPAINIYDVKECLLRSKANELLIRLDNFDLAYKEFKFKKLFEKMLDNLLKQAIDFDSRAWKMRVTLDKVLMKLKCRILALKKARENHLLNESMNVNQVDLNDSSLRTSNITVW